MPKKWMDSIFGHVVASKDLKLLLSIGGLYALSVALSNTFVNVFLWKQSGQFIDLALYNLMSVIFQPLAFLIAGKLSKHIDRVYVLRIGVSLMSLFYISVLVVGENAAQYLLLLGSLLGLGTGFYWLAFNVLTFEVTEPDTRDFFNGFLGLLTSFAGMTGPLTAGIMITKLNGFQGYFLIFGISLTLFLLAVILTIWLGKRHAKGKFEIKQVLKERKENKDWRKITWAHVTQGLREGTFVFVIVVWVYIVTNNELALGTYGLVTSGTQFIFYYLTARLLRVAYRKKAILIGGLMLYGAIFLLLFNLTFPKLIVYGIIISIAYPLLLIPYVSLTYDVIGKAHRAADLRVEYIIVREWFLNIGRIASILLFIAVISIFPEEQSIPYILLVVGSGHMWIYFFIKHINQPTRPPEPMPNVSQSEGENSPDKTV
ncbi:MFS transporter [Shouchella sp. JSM 1781072]|uniref:MFS transporter n=1 Tax=Bacillaceae TaxID=186817 RepID=UPI000C0700FA|nr:MULTISPECIES: MFS transporter [Bacillaceae]UTR07976.1 MFS transporter [Alkalihalobacillus sp. LMS6]